MGIRPTDIKVLWARAAGRCSHPECDTDLTPQLEITGDVVLGEMAHVRVRLTSLADHSVGVVGV